MLLGLPWRRAVLLGGALSLSIEVTQYFAIAGRDASLGDLLTNTTGTALGALLGATWRSVLFPSPGQATALSAAAATAWLLQIAMTGAAVLPSLPRSVYWGQRAPDLPQFETFRGRLLDGFVGDAPFPNLRMANSADIRERLLRGQVLGVVAMAAEPSRALAPIGSIFDGEQREIVLLGQWGEDLVFRLRSRAFDLRLQPPAIRLPACSARPLATPCGSAARSRPDASRSKRAGRVDIGRGASTSVRSGAGACCFHSPTPSAPRYDGWEDRHPREQSRAAHDGAGPAEKGARRRTLAEQRVLVGHLRAGGGLSREGAA